MGFTAKMLRTLMLRRSLIPSRPAKVLLALAAAFALTLAFPHCTRAAYTALYGSDGEDFVGFTGSSAISGLKPSGWNGLVMWALTVQPNGDITYNNGAVTLATGGRYTGPGNWASNIAALKAPPSTVYRYECALGGAGDSSFANIKNLAASQGTGSGSILFKNFQALKAAVPGIDAINYDDETTYDVGSATAFGRMLNGLGFQVSLAPYTNQSYWVQLRNNLGGGCDLCYLQCYQGGAGNDPAQWNSAFGGGFHVMGGIESNSNASGWTDWYNWAVGSGMTGGFYWPDIAWSPGSGWGPNDILNGIGIPNIGGHAIQLANLNSGLVLNAATSSNGNPSTFDAINQWASVNDNQIWTLTCTYQASNFWNSHWAMTYYINSSETLSTARQSQGGSYQLYPWYSGNSQQFTLTPSSWPGCYSVTFLDGFAMDDQWGGTGIGTPVQEWVPNNSNAQLWQLRFNPQTGY